MNAAVTAAIPDELQCFFPDCVDVAIEGQRYQIPNKNCKPMLNSDSSDKSIITRFSGLAILQSDQHHGNEVS